MSFLVLWIARLAMLFVGFIVAGVMLNVYYACFCFFTVFLLGIENEIVDSIQYWVCLIAGFATAFYLVRFGWPKADFMK